MNTVALVEALVNAYEAGAHSMSAGLRGCDAEEVTLFFQDCEEHVVRVVTELNKWRRSDLNEALIRTEAHKLCEARAKHWHGEGHDESAED